MKHRITVLISTLFLMLGGFTLPAHAQAGLAGGGLVIDLTGGGTYIGINLQVGSDSLFSTNFGGRLTSNLEFTGGFGLDFGLDAYAHIHGSNLLTFNIGGGATLFVVPNLYLTPHAYFGLDARVIKNLSVFLDLMPGISIPLQGQGGVAFEMYIIFGIRARF
jgi:hypothetical protein